MPRKTDWVALLFFSNANHVSLTTRNALGEVARRDHREFKLKVREVNFETEREACRQYQVYGVPLTLFYLNDQLIGRHYGETTPEEFETILKSYTERIKDRKDDLQESQATDRP